MHVFQGEARANRDDLSLCGATATVVGERSRESGLIEQLHIQRRSLVRCFRLLVLWLLGRRT